MTSFGTVCPPTATWLGFEFFVDFLEDERRTFLLGVSGG